MKLHSISNCFEKRGASPRRCWGRPWAPADRPSPSGSVPELEKLAAMSRLFGISLGWLLLWMRLDRAEARLTALESVRGDVSALDAAAQQVKVWTEGGRTGAGAGRLLWRGWTPWRTMAVTGNRCGRSRKRKTHRIWEGRGGAKYPPPPPQKPRAVQHAPPHRGPFLSFNGVHALHKHKAALNKFLSVRTCQQIFVIQLPQVSEKGVEQLHNPVRAEAEGGVPVAFV